MSIQLKNISKRFGNFVALDNVSLDIRSGELLALLGPSGSGKTTLLRIIAGLEFPDEGSVLIDGEETQLKNIQERHVGFVFQHYALFKHMTVFENVAFGLRVRPQKNRPNADDIHKRVMDLLALLHLAEFKNRYPMQLSGGQRQRVALARALAVEPRVLLLDEPFGALDAKVRRELRRWIRRLHDEIHITNVFVTHDQEEAMEVADRVAVLNNGRVEQIGTPEEVYHHPSNSFVYDFLGHYNEFNAWQDGDGNVHIVYTPSSKKVKVFARPHEMVVMKSPDEKDYIKTTLTHINPAGSLVKLELQRIDGSIIQADIQKEAFDNLALELLDKVYVRPKNVRVFDSSEG
jgi:sulfate transport system ATP-binding protein